MDNLSREQIDACCSVVIPQLRDYEEDEGLEYANEAGVRAAVAIALRQHAKGLSGLPWRRAVKQEFRGTQPEVGSVLLIISIILSLVRIWLELRDKPAV